MRCALALGVVFLSGCGGSEAAAPGPVAPESATTPAVASSAAPSNEPAPAAPKPELPRVEFPQIDPAVPPTKLPRVTIFAPARGQVIAAAKAKDTAVRISVTGWELGKAGDLCVMIDKHPCVALTDAKEKLTLGRLDETLDEGQHVITAFARRPTRESVKPVGKVAAFASQSFYVGKRTKPIWVDGAPMVLASEPADGPATPEGMLVDPYVANAELAAGKFTLHVAVTGPGLEDGVGLSTTSLAPFRLKNARPGEYVVRFSLFRYGAALGPSATTTTVKYDAKAVDSPFGEVTRRFRVTP